MAHLILFKKDVLLQREYFDLTYTNPIPLLLHDIYHYIFHQ